MKKSLCILLVMLFGSFITASAENKGYKGRVIVTPLQFEQKGDSLYIKLDLDLRNIKVGARRSISFIPVLSSNGYDLLLPEIIAKGRINYLTSKREVALMSKAKRNQYEKRLPYAIVKGYKNKKSIKTINYTRTMLFEPWMKNAIIDMKEDLCGCGRVPRAVAMTYLAKIKLEKAIVPYTMSYHIAYVQPVAEPLKIREMVGEAFLDFVVNRTDIRSDYMSNPRELRKITDMVTELKNDPAITVRKIRVVGYASPEGTLYSNKRLSEGRAEALVNYIFPMFNYPLNIYNTEFGGENWSGLLERVKNSDMAYRDEVLAILTSPDNNANADEKRKHLLKMLAKGEPYRYMLNEYYPSLRKAICKVDYIVRSFNTAEARDIIKISPKNLSLNEMYMVANSYEMGSPEFLDVFETAVNVFPEDQTANINAAAAALSRKDTISAERYLAEIYTKTAEYYNLMGVLMMLKNNYTEAKEHLNRSASAGLAQAKQNIVEIDKKILLSGKKVKKPL